MPMLKDADQTNVEKSELQQEEAGKSLEFKTLSRYRWNVLDLLHICGKKAITCYLFCDIDMSEVEKRRAQMDAEKNHVTVTPFLLKAIAIAQKNHPESRTLYLPNSRLVTYENVVAGFTVEKKVNGEPALFFGEIEEPHNKSIVELNKVLRDYADLDVMNVPKLREQKRFAEMPWFVRQVILFLVVWFPTVRLKCQSATFGLTSLGALGIPMACGPSVCTSVFGVGAVSNRVVVRDDQIVIRPILTLVLCYDHRALDPAQAASFINEIQELLEGGLAELRNYRETRDE